MPEASWISVEELFGDMEVQETDRVARAFEAARHTDGPRSSSVQGSEDASPSAPEEDRERT